MTLETLVAAYGYPAVFIGAILEGETVLLIAAVLVQKGLMDFKILLVVSAMGAFAGDQFFFLLGRLKGKDLFRRHPGWRQKIDRAVVLLDRRREVVTLLYRFIYGMRAVIPFLLGSGHCSVPRFALLSSLSAVAWALVIATGGYFLGEAFQQMLDQGRFLQKGIFVVAVLFAMAVMGLQWVIRRNGPRR